MTTARIIIRKRHLSAAVPGLHGAGVILAAGMLIFELVPARAEDRAIAIEIAVEEELGDEVPADQSWFGESGGEPAGDAEVEGEPAAGERPDLLPDGEAAPEPVPGAAPDMPDGRDGGSSSTP